MADFAGAVKKAVYYKIGKIGDKPRMVKAPFDVVIMDGEHYVTPDGFHGELEDEFSRILTGSIQADSEEGYRNRLSDNGWVDEMIVVEPHEMGDVQFDTWKSVHAFGLL